MMKSEASISCARLFHPIMIAWGYGCHRNIDHSVGCWPGLNRTREWARLVCFHLLPYRTDDMMFLLESHEAFVVSNVSAGWGDFNPTGYILLWFHCSEFLHMFSLSVLTESLQPSIKLLDRINFKVLLFFLLFQQRVVGMLLPFTPAYLIKYFGFSFLLLIIGEFCKIFTYCTSTVVKSVYFLALHSFRKGF